MSSTSLTYDDEKTRETRTPDSSLQSDIPDGGLHAYLQVVGAHLLFFNSWGIINSFGVYQEYYSTALLSHESASSISWIGTLQGFLLFLIGILTGPVFDRGYFRHLIILGAFLVVFGMLMTSLGTTYYQIILAQGVCVGLGAGCLFVPSVAIVATYFTSKRALMTGFTAAGGSIGGIIYPIVFHKLQPIVGFPWATRIIAFMVLSMLCVSLAIMRTRTAPPPKARALLDLSAFREAPFNIFSLALFLTFIGVYFPFFYASIYGSRVTRLDDDVSFYLLPVLNAGSIFGRIVPGLVADKAGSLNTIIPFAVIAAILEFAWLDITNAPGLWVFSVLYGFFSGAVVTLPSTIITLISPDLSLVGTRMGMSFTFSGLGLLIGNPIAGSILNVQDGKFKPAIAFCAATQMAGAIALIGVRTRLLRSRKGWKA
ncbi:MAG: hypothetical protein Q9182_004429 [Xanthomendoza sp. 2 TL-2023]